ncbi:hypothetical protein B0H14DRAFT_2644362 [Mycena olivaceomarginata]|nr:hypothetical protein B0H14DRAFT_2644362 [Mycena olivaceomarginata]
MITPIDPQITSPPLPRGVSTILGINPNRKPTATVPMFWPEARPASLLVAALHETHAVRFSMGTHDGCLSHAALARSLRSPPRESARWRVPPPQLGVHPITPLLPLFHIFKPPDAVPLFYSPDVSQETSAVIWALETSTDPAVVMIAAELVPELHWPVNLQASYVGRGHALGLRTDGNVRLVSIRSRHKSFRDYIMDVHAPVEFHVLMGYAHFVTARSCMQVIVKRERQSDVVVKYSVGHWYRHLRRAVEGGVTDEDERMWELFEQMVEEAVVDIWKVESWQVFIDIAAVGWGGSR